MNGCQNPHTQCCKTWSKRSDVGWREVWIWNLGIQLTLRFSITTMPIEAACHLACYHLVQAFLRKTEPSNSQPWIHIYTYAHTHTHICMTLAQHLYIDLYCDVGCLEGKHGFWSQPVWVELNQWNHAFKRGNIAFKKDKFSGSFFPAANVVSYWVANSVAILTSHMEVKNTSHNTNLFALIMIIPSGLFKHWMLFLLHTSW